MWTTILWPALPRLIGGAITVLILTYKLPSDPIERQLWGAALGLLAPLLALGRRELLNRAAYHHYQRTLTHPRLWELKGLLPAFSILIFWSLLVSQAQGPLFVVYLSWYSLCLLIGDFFDVKRERLGEAWAYTSVVLISLITAPLWGALWFGETPFTPWVATLSIGLHPTFAAVSSSAEVALQVPLLYQNTLSGLVEVRSLPWWIAPVCYVAVSLTLLELITRSPINTEARKGVY